MRLRKRQDGPPSGRLTGVNRRANRLSPRPTTSSSAGAATVVGLAAVLSLAGCQWTSPLATQKIYDPADGVSAKVGAVQLRNVLIVSGQSGGPGTLVAWAENPTDKPVTISFAAGSEAPIPLAVPAGATAQLRGEPGKLAAIKAVAAEPGALAKVTASSPSGGAVAFDVPVLYPAPESQYAKLAPAGFTPRPAPSPSSAAAPAH